MAMKNSSSKWSNCVFNNTLSNPAIKTMRIKGVAFTITYILWVYTGNDITLTKLLTGSLWPKRWGLEPTKRNTAVANIKERSRVPCAVLSLSDKQVCRYHKLPRVTLLNWRINVGWGVKNLLKRASVFITSQGKVASKTLVFIIQPTHNPTGGVVLAKLHNIKLYNAPYLLRWFIPL